MGFIPYVPNELVYQHLVLYCYQSCNDNIFKYQKVKFVFLIFQFYSSFRFKRLTLDLFQYFVCGSKGIVKQNSVCTSFSSISQGLHVHKRLWWALILYKTYKRTYVAFFSFFFTCFWFFPFSLSLSLFLSLSFCPSLNNLLQDDKRSQRVPRNLVVGMMVSREWHMLEKQTWMSSKIAIRYSQHVQDLVWLKITTPMMLKRSN